MFLEQRDDSYIGSVVSFTGQITSQRRKGGRGFTRFTWELLCRVGNRRALLGSVDRPVIRQLERRENIGKWRHLENPGRY